VRELAGKVAVVTGAASGIGLALARRFAAEGMRVVLSDLRREPLEHATAELRAAGREVLAVGADVSNAGDVESLAASVWSAFGDVHVLCNNAGVASAGGRVWEIDEADWSESLDVNFRGVLHGIRAFVPRMVERGERAHVVNTASIAGLTSTMLFAPYVVSKHAVVALSECLHHDLSLVGAPIRVSVLCPHYVRTSILDGPRTRPGYPDRPEAPSDPLLQRLAEESRRAVETGIAPDEVAQTVLEAIREERFLILTHDETREMISARIDALLSGREPVQPDLRGP
jgi:NAD(P)-dependent dehydrogenase (short-subunit alcohol dehydrogenase family)